MESFELETRNEHSAIYVNKEAQRQLENAWSEIDDDHHFYERSTWILQVVLTRDEQYKSDSSLSVKLMAQNNAQLLDAHEAWSCMEYSYNSDEMCFIVFVHEAEDKPLLWSEVERQCRELVSDVGWHTYVMSHHKKESYDLFRYIYMYSIEERYKTTHGYYDPK